MCLATFVLPVAPYHEGALSRALASIAVQTVPCETMVVPDTERRGAGWARNAGLAQVTTPYVVFLDADDTVTPDFVERCLAVRKRHHYVYTDFANERGQQFDAPDCAWTNRTWHCVTTLLPTAFARAVGGFDERLSAGEDTDFYMKLNAAGYCGQRLAQPLLIYDTGGQRSKVFADRATNERFLDLMKARYGGKRMSCCGNGTMEIPMTPANEPFDGAELAQAQWGGNRVVRGRVTGRMYARCSHPATLWVDSRDIDAAPHEFQRAAIRAADPLDADDVAAFETLALEATGGQRPPKVVDGAPLPPPVKGNTSRAAAKVKKAAAK